MDKKDVCHELGSILIWISFFGFLFYIIPLKYPSLGSKLPILHPIVLYITGVVFLIGVILIFVGISLDKTLPWDYSSKKTTGGEENISISESSVCSQCGGHGYYWDHPGPCPACGGTGKSGGVPEEESDNIN